jgi:hypothetical protein
MAMPDTGESRSGFWLWLVAASAVVVAGGLIYSSLQQRQPRYQGRTSAQWFRDFQRAVGNHWKTVGGAPAATIYVGPTGTIRILDRQGLMGDPAAAGLRALGTNAAIYLGHQYTHREGLLVRTYLKLYFRLPLSTRRCLPKPPTLSYSREELALALQALGPDASAAAPYLITSLKGANQFAFVSTVGLLRDMAFNPHALDSLLEDRSKLGQYTNVQTAVVQLKLRTPVAARCLAKELTHPDEQVRYGAARALEEIGSIAVPAIPALRQATNDSSVMVQRASARALRVIQGQQTD